MEIARSEKCVPKSRPIRCVHSIAHIVKNEIKSSKVSILNILFCLVQTMYLHNVLEVNLSEKNMIGCYQNVTEV